MITFESALGLVQALISCISIEVAIPTAFGVLAVMWIIRQSLHWFKKIEWAKIDGKLRDLILRCVSFIVAGVVYQILVINQIIEPIQGFWAAVVNGIFATICANGGWVQMKAGWRGMIAIKLGFKIIYRKLFGQKMPNIDVKED